MAFQIVWSEPAEERILEFLEFIGAENPTAAVRVIKDLYHRIRALSNQPRMGKRITGHDPGVRRLIVGQYVVIYRLHESRQLIVIVGVRHSRQRSLREEDV